MTPKQAQRLKDKISNIRRTLAAEKRKYGCYDDSRGLRYLPVKYFVTLGDFKGGMTYLRWFNKNFPDDCGFPEFLFEWTIILYQSGKITEAKAKAFKTFCSNTYLFDKFYGRPVVPVDKEEGSNLEQPEFTAYFDYSSEDPNLGDFSEWLSNLIESEDFRTRCDSYVAVQKRLKHETDREMRQYLIRHAWQLKEWG